MKRNVKSVFKFVLLSGVTVLCTVVLFRLLRYKSPNFEKLSNSNLIRNTDPFPVPPEDVSSEYL